MTVHRIRVSGIRNLSPLKMEELGRINLIYGENGSGKTSLLESVYMLGMTRSFRNRKMETVISRSGDAAIVWGEISSGGRGYRRTIGVERSRYRRPTVKLDGAPVSSIGELGGILPLQVINSDSFRLLEGSPAFRRELLDWGVFHVEHREFFSVWQRYRRALQQRNSLLRRGKIGDGELQVWDRELVNTGEALHAYRDFQHQRLVETVAETYRCLIHSDDRISGEISFDYYPGWEKRKPLQQELSEGLDRDLRLGHTRAGPHRADIRIRVDGAPAAEVLSRGQTKTLVCAIRIAQGKLLKQSGIDSVYLIDDLAAELDSGRRSAIGRALTDIGLQLFATSIRAGDLDDCWPDNSGIRRFHVEHGRVTPD